MVRLHLKALSLIITAALARITSTHDNVSPRGYSDYHVYRFYTNNASYIVKDLIRPITQDFDVWTTAQDFVDILLPRTINPESLKLDSLEYKLLIDDIDLLVEETLGDQSEESVVADYYNDDSRETIGSRLLKLFGVTKDQWSFHAKSHRNYFFNRYRDLESIELWYKLLEKSFPDLVYMETIGKTPRGNEMKAIHITSNHNNDNPDKKTIIVTAGTHAREWISVSTACYLMYQLLSNYETRKSETKFLDSLDFIFVPVFNPDGYEYTWTTDRLWRKNRQITGIIQGCDGIDIDRSFSFAWSNSSETDPFFGFPCDENYNGQTPMEAIEAQLWDSYLNGIKKELKIFGFLDLHSYAQEILYPYAYSCDALPRDLENLIELSYGLSKAIRNEKSHEEYAVAPACRDTGADLTPGIGGGSLLDYMYHNRAYWALQLKLRDTGNYGFLLPPKYIIPVGREIYSAFRYFCEFIINPEL